MSDEKEKRIPENSECRRRRAGGLVFNKNGVYVGSATSGREKENLARRASREEKDCNR